MQVSIRSCLRLLVSSVLRPALAAARAGVLWAMRRIERAMHPHRPAGLPVPHAALPRASQDQRFLVLGRLTGGVAHDVNNLLGVISNSAHLIQRQAAGADIQVAVAATLSAVEAGSRLTQLLLRLAGNRPAQVQVQVVALERFLGDSQELLAMVLGPHIAARVSVAPGTQPVEVDGGELELALINLALDARDAMPAGGRVWLKARNAQPQELPGLKPGSYVLITFTDEGVGQGTGPGLCQVRGFCVQAGGTAHWASTPGLGTTAAMVLPAAAGEPGTVPPAAEPAVSVRYRDGPG